MIAIDSTVLGPAAGGIRTRAYPTLDAAIADASGLARAMTLKCALAGLDAGGGKAVVMDLPELDRPRAFARLGEIIEGLGGAFRTAGDLGTTAADLAAAASRCHYVHTDERGLADAVGRGLLRCVEACAAVRGVPVIGLRVAVQGAGMIGAGAARALAVAGARVLIADVDAARAAAVASATGAEVVDPAAVLELDVDLVAPCAIGGAIDAALAGRLRAWAVCGAANGILAPGAAAILQSRGILHVPDVISSAGAVIEGIGRTVMGLPDRTPLIDRLGDTARAILQESLAGRGTPDEVAERRARARIAAARG